ncbi:MAG: aminotransferase class I/II-fold pyridoxal phosphate-dependent enzyme [Oscillospiraceae bacterium]|nr:aminotransferase class I/II-fold pyridoxal phosphate-dependent enzyme [Oscillospiraceae bacterium]
MLNYDNLYANTVKNLKPSGIRRFFGIAAEIPDVISLGVGEPDFVTPQAIRDAGIASLKAGETKYTANAGLKEVQAGVSGYLKRRFDLDYDPSQVLVTVGASEGIDLALRAFINPGDEVLIPEPSFVAYDAMTRINHGVPVSIVTKEEDEFRLTPAALKAAITPKTKMLIFPYPCNPTGGVMRREHMLEIAEVLKDTDILVLSDEIYAELTYGGIPHVSFAAIPGMYDRTILVNGFSKAYAMTGWRLGYLTGCKEAVDMMCKIHQYALMTAPTTAQYAAIAALKPECDAEIAAMCASYDERRKMLISRLNGMGLQCFMPDGAFYAFPSIQKTGMKSLEFCEALLRSKKVALVPGDAFGECGEGFIRVCYCYATEHLVEALNRMEAFLKEIEK